jgi:hypothetical protein
MKTIKFTVDKKGKVSMEAIGFKGTECSEATAKFTRVLGRVEAEEKKPEFFESSDACLENQ